MPQYFQVVTFRYCKLYDVLKFGNWRTNFPYETAFPYKPPPHALTTIRTTIDQLLKNDTYF